VGAWLKRICQPSTTQRPWFKDKVSAFEQPAYAVVAGMTGYCFFIEGCGYDVTNMDVLENYYAATEWDTVCHSPAMSFAAAF
jgi:hypothetical protein